MRLFLWGIFLPVDTVLYNTKVYVHGNLVDAGIAIDNGRIVKIAKKTNLPLASKTIDLKGQITLPGLIDSHVHLRDQQLAYKEDFVTGTAAAAAGGVTSIIDMPNNKPVTMSVSSLKKRISQAEKRVLVNVAFNSAFPKTLDEISEIVDAGAIAFKVYLSNRIGGINIDDDEQLLNAFQEAAKNGVPVSVHAEDRETICQLRRELEMTGQNDTEAYVKVHSPHVEAKAIKRVIQVIKNSGVHVHFCHLSSVEGLDAILTAKNDGLHVTCEATPHNLLLSSKHYGLSGFLALTDPPLRSQPDVSYLWSSLKRGNIDIIASDHAPHALEEKKTNSVWDTKPGIPGLETTLSLLLTQVNAGRLSIQDLVRLTSEQPAKIFNVNRRGFLEEGNWADIVIVDMNCEHVIDVSLFHSKAKYSPFNRMRVKGKPVKTFVNGKLIMDAGEIVAEPGFGHILRNMPAFV